MDTAIMTGYMNEWNRYKCNLTQMAKHGYNSLIFAHANVHGRYVHMAQELLNTHTGREILSKDIETAKFGQPSDETGGKFSIFNRKDKKDTIYELIKEQYESISGDHQFGGAVVWDVKADSNNSYRFVEAVKNSIEPMKHIVPGHRRPPYMFNYSHMKTKVS